ncbi:UbiD family decarboxylase domain-containing protein [Streptomyces sp. NPDC048254]|uniref:UbiD family decarboxylase domain-containing protein n=1 Tax=Streptomyces sp. NPDC048254 TaxID=3365525 RepID=UPI00371E51CB
MNRWAEFPVKPEWRDNPLWAQNSVEGEDVNIFDILPLVRLNDGDGGFYIDKAGIVSKDPDDPDNSGKQNVGIYRIEVLPTVLADPACLDAGTYLGGQDRVVLIAHFTSAPPPLPAPPDDLLLRSVHQWPFRRHATCRGSAAHASAASAAG